MLKRRATEHELEQSERGERERERNGEIHRRGKIAHGCGHI